MFLQVPEPIPSSPLIKSFFQIYRKCSGSFLGQSLLIFHLKSVENDVGACWGIPSGSLIESSSKVNTKLFLELPGSIPSGFLVIKSLSEMYDFFPGDPWANSLTHFFIRSLSMENTCGGFHDLPSQSSPELLRQECQPGSQVSHSTSKPAR